MVCLNSVLLSNFSNFRAESQTYSYRYQKARGSSSGELYDDSRQQIEIGENGYRVSQYCGKWRQIEEA